ncbi:MAG: caspase family protein [Clostridia bacterium]|nr:caspase family protein [Clostridia bacterium]
MKRMLCWLLGLLCLFCASAEKADDPAVCRALLVGCDVFLTHEDTAPSAALNVERMDRMLRTDARGYAAVTRRDAGLADVAALQAAVEEAFAGADDNDVSFLYFCTHGLYDRVSLEPLLVLSDGVSENSLSARALRELLDRVPGKKILVIDACNSGAFIGRGVRDGQNAFSGGDYRVLTSAGGYENSFLWRDRQQSGGSYFAQELCEGLRGRDFDVNQDGAVTLAEAHAGLLECCGASTAQASPLGDDTPLYVYDPAVSDGGERPLGDILLDTNVLTGREDTLYFSFTVRRPVRVQYQIIYYRGGQWRFDAPQIVEDAENARGALTPGRKQRAVTLVSEDEAPYGYALLQIVAQEGRSAMLAGSRLIAVQPEEGDPGLRARAFSDGREVGVYVRHAFPCSLTVKVLDGSGQQVATLAYKSPSRPTGERQDGSFFHWDAADVPAGEYAVEVTSRVGGETYTQRSAAFRVE